jgi:hypothetical protein
MLSIEGEQAIGRQRPPEREVVERIIGNMMVKLPGDWLRGQD